MEEAEPATIAAGQIFDRSGPVDETIERPDLHAAILRPLKGDTTHPAVTGGIEALGKDACVMHHDHPPWDDRPVPKVELFQGVIVDVGSIDQDQMRHAAELCSGGYNRVWRYRIADR